ncbi:TfoX/Sxy family DNA transformation protein [Vibrio sp. SCSIO 43137]|uniref:TfoX/Sxy family DNA transformation protein n=1 Tax=Vibrio sp. SCSIO 43137 TaxID=3021011 RepID=UPI002307B87F|nr:TfoX/Sxy family DNA transformation protein [Vibrio sp. SCSIO 43137]WCE30869.1 TfoX/Sxy family DNA transformation protein [Vibrio sp. SCSIO 43137]
MENIVSFPNEDYVLDTIAEHCDIERNALKVHYMFKYHILSFHGHAFAMIIDGRLALKFGNNKMLQQRLLLAGGQEVYDYSEVTKKMSYYSIHEDCFTLISIECLELVKKVMYYWYNLGEAPNVPSINKMINITKTLALSLNNIGVNSVDDLMSMGSYQAYNKLKATDPDIPDSYFSRLEGAITNKHYMFVEEFYTQAS